MKKCLDKSSIIELLKKNPVKNASLLSKLSYPRNNFIEGYIHNNSVFLRIEEKYEPGNHFSIENEEDIKELAKCLNEDDCWFPSLESWLIPYIQKGREISYYEPCTSLYLPKNINFPFFDLEKKIKPLRALDAELVNDRWPFKSDWSKEYLTYQIENDLTAAIYENNNPVAWCLMHDDGSMGSMWVEEKFRKNNFATAISNYMIKNLRSQQRVPFVYIVKGNIKSYNLAVKAGFIVRGDYCWLEFKK